ncbi:sensor histidine kinase [Companilactobacillus keshanensis]|uniref:histidine kinase n=1 Tax=Companilactobacillus keshanensis TaxID=2486003 RepID=A0ABW4BU31_9LACO|nr:histidine kinase [Companilactobacillus keshanensis]
MTFLENHVLFPKRFGIMPYFWAFSLIALSSQSLFEKNSFNWILFSLLLIFLKLYRDGYEINRLLPLQIVGQLIITTYLVYEYNLGTLFIFTAWEIGSLPFKNKQFYRYTAIYLIFSILCISGNILVNFKSYGIYGIIITAVFAVGSPFAARSLGNSYRRMYRLKQNNKRLETIIKQNERERISKDLHDNLGQSFSLITLKAELADKLMDKNAEQARQEIKDIAATSRDDLSLVRQIVSDLNQKSIAEAMIEEENNLRIVNIIQQSNNEKVSATWPIKIQNVLAAIIKEASTNIIKYSKAHTATFDFGQDHDYYTLDISDDGVGYKKVRKDSFGLTGISQRLSDINGVIDISSDHGTILKIKVKKAD